LFGFVGVFKPNTQSTYPNATSLLVLMDGGGSNSSGYYLFKQDLQALTDTLGIPIRVAHYPPYL
jgi:hypothetical protein